jgi:hypothetical protein
VLQLQLHPDQALLNERQRRSLALLLLPRHLLLLICCRGAGAAAGLAHRLESRLAAGRASHRPGALACPASG